MYRVHRDQCYIQNNSTQNDYLSQIQRKCKMFRYSILGPCLTFLNDFLVDFPLSNRRKIFTIY